MCWADVGEIIKAIAPIFTAGAACFGAYIAYRGLEKWRAETIGKRKVELAEEVLADFYEAREIIELARTPGGFHNNEGNTREKAEWETDRDTRALNAYYRTAERLASKADFFARHNAHRYRFIALFGSEAAKPFEDLSRIRGEVLTAVRLLITAYSQPNKDYLQPSITQWQQKIGWPQGQGVEELINPELDRIVTSIEKICQPIIQNRPP